MTLFLDSLDQLFQETMAAERKRKFSKTASPLKKDITETQTIRELYANPDNWIQKSSIALIHRSNSGAETLLGNFTEFLHKRTLARKLVRIEGPHIVSSLEFVKGEWWFGNFVSPLPEIPEPTVYSTLEVQTNLELECLEVAAQDVPLIIERKGIFIQAVRLSRSTQFVCPSNHTILTLPKNLNVLEAMSFSSKVALKNLCDSLTSSAPSN